MVRYDQPPCIAPSDRQCPPEAGPFGLEASWPTIALVVGCGVLLILTIVFLILWLNAKNRKVVTAAPPPVVQALANEQFLTELITLADLATTPAMIAQSTRILGSIGVGQVSAQPGTRFDPNVHSAVSALASADPTIAGTIVTLVRPGWQTGNRVIRPAEVTVHTN
jgi:GrpE